MSRFPAPGVLAPARGYASSRPARPLDLLLDGNEGPLPDFDLGAALAAAGPECLRRYPDARALELALAARHGRSADEVLVTAGADEALDRIARAWLGPGRELLLPVPTFEMLARYAELSGATVRAVDWPPGKAWPLADVLGAASASTGVVAVVSPNNPTGSTVAPEALRQLARRLPDTVVLVDLAYDEFAEQELERVARELPNALVVRTFSKARGLAGLRVGYVLGPAEALAILRRAGGPYSVAGPSLALARYALELGEDGLRRTAARVRGEREALGVLAAELGSQAFPSAANFVLWRTRDAGWLADGLASLGIGVRRFPGRPGLGRDVRITCPISARDFARLVHALQTVERPEALLFDMDGVLVDASASYDATILAVAAELGLVLAPAELHAERRRGGANDDVVLLARLCAAHGRQLSRAELEQRFEQHYWGRAGEGLCRRERPLVPRALLAEFARRLPLAIVTGRPRRDAERFLSAEGLDELFAHVLCSEDAARKPDPAPVRRALAALGVERAWMLGDTVDDVRAARAAGVVSLGLVAPGDDDEAAAQSALIAAGAARVLTSPTELLSLLP